MNPDTNPHDIQPHNPLQAHQPGEQIVCEIKRHPFGVIVIYLGVGFVLALLTFLIVNVLPGLSTSSQEGLNALGSMILIVTAVLGVGFAFVNQIVYWGNRWIVTSDSITQVQQTGLFSKQASQLSLENLEDVTAVKKGIMAHVLNYGTLNAETAGERSKFSITYCPNPEEYARKILNARELFMLKEDSRQHQADPSHQTVTTP